MKRLILTTIVCFILCLSFSINSFADGVGGALSGIGSGIDPRTDGRYKDKFELDSSSSNDTYFAENNATYGDVVFTYFQTYSTADGNKTVELKCYLRVWYIPDEFNNPCICWTVGTNGAGNLSIRYQNSSPKRLAWSKGTELYNGTFDVWHGATGSNVSSQSYFTYQTMMGKIIYSDFPVFTDVNDCEYYCSTNQVRNSMYDPSPKDYSSELYFKSFEVIPHASNKVGAYYFDIKYELSDYAKRNIDKLNLNFENMHQIDFSGLDEIIKTSYKTNWYSNSIALKDYPYGFVIYVKDLGCYAEAVEGFRPFEGIIIGEIFIVDTVNTILQSLMPEVSAAKVERSVVYFRFNLRFSESSGVVVGKRNDFTYDFVSKESSKYIYAPNTTTDSSGNTTVVKDSNGNVTYTQEGDKVTSNDYYYNKVTETNEGDTTNVTNNYYYYDKDGKQQEISEDEYNNSSFTVSGGDGGDASAEGGSASAEANASVGDININIGNGSGEYIDISPQSYNNFVAAMKTLLEELNPQGGLFLLLHDAYSVFPASIWLIVGGGLAAAVTVSLVCILRR